jgi:hypothetical protein
VFFIPEAPNGATVTNITSRKENERKEKKENL